MGGDPQGCDDGVISWQSRAKTNAASGPFLVALMFDRISSTNRTDSREHERGVAVQVNGGTTVDTTRTITVLESYEADLAAILSRFTRSRDSIHIAREDDPLFRQRVGELVDLFDDSLGKNRYSAQIRDEFREGISNFFGSPSYKSVENILSVVRSALTRLKRNPGLLERDSRETREGEQGLGPCLSLPRTAVFIDGDWLVHTARRLNKTIDFRDFRDALRGTFGSSAELRIYLSVTEGDSKHEGFLRSLEALGFGVSTVSMIQLGASLVSKGLDVQLATDAATVPRDTDRLVLISGDKDFIPLLRVSRKQGRSTVLISLPGVAARDLAAAADYMMTVEDWLQSAEPRTDYEGEERLLLPHSALPREAYFEKGDHLEGYLFVRRIITEAKDELTIIDPYLNDEALLLVRLLGPGTEVIVLTNKVGPEDFCVLVRKLRSEGRKIRIYGTKEFHDRFIKADAKWWHSGHSLKDLERRPV